MSDLNTHRFPLQVGEIVHVGGIPYAYAGGGMLEGGTDPAFARGIHASCSNTADGALTAAGPVAGVANAPASCPG